MITQLLATKRHMTQAWTQDGVRVPVSVVRASDCTVIGKGNTQGKLLVGAHGKKLKNTAKPQRSLFEKAGLTMGFTKVAEITADTQDVETLTAGKKITPAQVFSVGDIVKVTGTSKGSGFTGVVKRHGFAGGPRTHGQADRERAPGSIGSGTTPGRVYKNKRMAGRAGNERVTIEGLQIVAIHGDDVWIKGLIPGSINGVVTLTKVSEGKFAGLIGIEEKQVVEPMPEVVSEQAPAEVAQEEVKAQ